MRINVNSDPREFLDSDICRAKSSLSGIRSTAVLIDEFEEYIGKKPEDVVRGIEAKYPSYQVHPIRSDMFATMDYRLDRIRLFYDKDTNLVTQAGIG